MMDFQAALFVVERATAAHPFSGCLSFQHHNHVKQAGAQQKDNGNFEQIAAQDAGVF